MLKNTPLLVVIDKELKIEEVGQPINGRITEPAYSFDKLVVPIGTELTGKNHSARGRIRSQARTLGPKKRIHLAKGQAQLRRK